MTYVVVIVGWLLVGWTLLEFANQHEARTTNKGVPWGAAAYMIFLWPVAIYRALREMRRRR